ncbi:phosphoribosylglycinamide formyltransferase [Allohahella sp. A8]|uniref:phosphoribosylglycinamide formyltransferase n=1 Tax=Allohahella sp. A8 TaxID=3141461 RepID=UPI000C0B77D7|nr:phosphoribosylglycinamide formyltransferase [Hahellaceae bacterium]|tara:strand:+ start:73196 stop:73912 length:717 start_codon:yes stop_codon:yes gene_type:complete
MSQAFRLVVLISGNGSNLQAILDAISAGQLKAVVAAVISNRADAYGLQRAAAAGVRGEVLDHGSFASREAFDEALAERIDAYAPDIIVAAGFMRIFSTGFVDRFAGRTINIHPSLLPAYTGLHTHRRVLDDLRGGGAAIHGCSVHFVTGELDGGPCIAQASVPVFHGDTAEALAKRVHVQEHQLLPQVLMWLSEGRVGYDRVNEMPDRISLDGQCLPPSGLRIDNVFKNEVESHEIQD